MLQEQLFFQVGGLHTLRKQKQFPSLWRKTFRSSHVTLLLILQKKTSLFLHAFPAKKIEDFLLITLHTNVSFVLFVLASPLWSYSQMSGNANWFHSRKDLHDLALKSLMSFTLCERLQTKQPSSSVASRLFLKLAVLIDHKNLQLFRRGSHQKFFIEAVMSIFKLCNVGLTIINE